MRELSEFEKKAMFGLAMAIAIFLTLIIAYSLLYVAGVFEPDWDYRQAEEIIRIGNELDSLKSVVSKLEITSETR